MLTKTPNKALICVKGDREILYGHCSCMAGLGEVCYHVGTIMFYLLLTSEYCRRNSEMKCLYVTTMFMASSLFERSWICWTFKYRFYDPRKRLSKSKVNAPKQALRKFVPHED